VAERSPAPKRRLRLDPVACDGVGICAHLAPDLIRLDTWGYPIVAATALDGASERQATAATAACPRKALFIRG
jgi:ferredoxin